MKRTLCDWRMNTNDKCPHCGAFVEDQFAYECGTWVGLPQSKLCRERAARQKAEVERDEMERRKDNAYLERNQCVALIARMAVALGHQACVTRTAIEGWSEDWHGCVYINLPTGQVSWHFHDSQRHLFDGLPVAGGVKWDGHDTPEKYRRVSEAFGPIPTSLVGELKSELAETRKELEKLRAIIKDPAAVYINLLNGEIAMPMTVRAALNNYTKSERANVCGFDAQAHTVTLRFEEMPIVRIGESWAVVTADATRTWQDAGMATPEAKEGK